MSLQLLALAIYNRNGDRRDVVFRPGALNIITGKSLTGKSALIDIVDYCLGRDKYVIPSGVIADNVVWYVLHVLLPHGQAVIGRPAPERAESTTAAYLEVGGDLALPNFATLRTNTNTKALEQFLSEAIGITANENVPPAGQSRAPLQTNISHARFLLFQPQNTIADREVMFYRQKEPFIPQAIKDSLPYFLGATGDDQYDRLQKLRRLQREVRLRERRLEEEQALRGHENDRAVALIAEARNAGLLSPGGPPPHDFAEAVAVLQPLTAMVPTAEESNPNSTLNTLQNEREGLLSELRAAQNEIDAARAFASAQEGFSVEAGDQRNRLSSVGLFREEPEVNRCPVCDHDLSGTVPKADSLRANLANLDRQIIAATRQRPRLESFLTQKEEFVADLRRRLRENKGAIDALVLQEEALQQERNRYVEQAHVSGRISLFLESVRVAVEGGELDAQIADLRRRIAELEEGLFGDLAEDRLVSILQLIARDMSARARELELEHSEWPIGFDLKNLTVVAHRASGPTRLPQMGGGKNALGYHLVVMLALHKHFRDANRPVPGLLMLDQPTQVYFPSERAEDRSVDDLLDEDQHAVHRLFKMIYDFTRQLSPAMQVIITDHADLEEPWFQESIVERWRGDNKLVPQSWYQMAETEGGSPDESEPSDETADDGEQR